MAAKLPPCDGAAQRADGRSAYVFRLHLVVRLGLLSHISLIT
jgi:hypothetical protein